jgi:two-component system chemotaxis response regulator CheB
VRQQCPNPELDKARREKHLPNSYRLVAMGASAGGFHSLCAVLEPLPASFPCPIVVVQHLSPFYKSILADLLARKTALAVAKASDRERMQAGRVYVGPPDLHLVVEYGYIRLLQTPELQHHRPSIDVMFESIASAYGPQALAIVLSGSGNDGAKGVVAVRHAGGRTLCEDPMEAEFRSMPEAAIATGCVDMIVGLDKIAGVIAGLCCPEQK